MKQTTIEIDRERRSWEQRRNAYRNILHKSGGYMSEAQLAGYKTAIADCENKITELADEINERRAQNGLVIQ